ncbi:uncharacterized protein LOC100214627 isoform X1 [Hydra vulgaris]|uniref:uncharacterized protein LOC100214627 isoform X1 n=1 Tax=Hydra vulgaris TaxID=6087 RepID=UPI0006410D74|nr:E3 ubiquitin-protein ligase SIRP1 isoform X1 [Hydra vulgaris]
MFQCLDAQSENISTPSQRSLSIDLPELISDSDDEQNMRSSLLPNLSYHEEEESSRSTASDSDSDDSSAAPYSIMDDFSDDSSSDTSEDDFMFDGYLSDDSSIGDYEYVGEMGVLEALNQQLEAFSNIIPSFFGVSLQMLYGRLNSHLFGDDDKPTPQHILDSLPRLKVTIAQLASKASCCICFGEYTLNEDILQFPCNHFYHSACVLNWLKIKSTCPTCRYDLTQMITSNDGIPEPNVINDYSQSIFIDQPINTNESIAQSSYDIVNPPSADANFSNHFHIGNSNRNSTRYDSYNGLSSDISRCNSSNIETAYSSNLDNRDAYLCNDISEIRRSDVETNLNQCPSRSNAELRFSAIFEKEVDSSLINVESQRNLSKIKSGTTLSVRDTKKPSRETDIW